MRKADDENGNPGTDWFDWEQFQNHFFGGGGWKEAMNGKTAGTIPWVDRYVKGILADTVHGTTNRQFEQTPLSSKQSSIACNVFETHQAMIVRIRLSAETDAHEIRLLAAPNELKIYGLPGDEDKTIKLSAPVRIDGAKAICKQRILEVTLVKEREGPAQEIPIRFIE